MKETKCNITLIAGPTASGKSRLAVDMASCQDSVIINADSMQVYDMLRILTARPSRDEMGGVTHHLYGFVPPQQHFSVGLWYQAVRELLAKPDLQGRNVIFVGGTGLYFRALGGGLSEMPPIPSTLRDMLRQRLQNEGREKLHQELQRDDPVAAAHILPQDAQRILRALEILLATGRSIHDWQQQKTASLINMTHAQKILLLPERATLYSRIERRFDQMLAQGALAEVRALMALGISDDMPAYKTIGVRELAHVLDGTWSMDMAAQQAKAATRRYAKRQMTWFRTQFGKDWQIIANV